MTSYRLKELIDRYWAGTATRQELEALLAALDSHELKGRQEQEGLECELEEVLDPTRKEMLFQQIVTSIQSKEGQIGQKDRRRFLSLKKALRAAAVILILMGSAVTIWMLQQNAAKKTLAVKHPVKVLRDTLFNRGAEIQTFRLPDQSVVQLYPNSYVSYVHPFDQRDILLNGKAEFEVRHDAGRVFTVTTHDIVTTDIGTTFVIDGRKKDKISIKLIEGEVKVSAVAGSRFKLEEQHLRENELLKINTKTGKIRLEKIEPKIVRRKTAGPLVFNKTPLTEVFSAISLKYHVAIGFQKEDIESLTFTGNVEPGDAVSNILTIICAINNLTVSKNETGFVISKPLK